MMSICCFMSKWSSVKPSWVEQIMKRQISSIAYKRWYTFHLPWSNTGFDSCPLCRSLGWCFWICLWQNCTCLQSLGWTSCMERDLLSYQGRRCTLSGTRQFYIAIQVAWPWVDRSSPYRLHCESTSWLIGSQSICHSCPIRIHQRKIPQFPHVKQSLNQDTCLRIQLCLGWYVSAFPASRLRILEWTRPAFALWERLFLL